MAESHDSLGILGSYASTALGRGAENRDSALPTIHGKLRFPVDITPETKRTDYGAVIRRYALQSAARDLLPREQVAKCMRKAIPSAEQPGITVLYAPAKQAAHFGGLQICKSVWHCPVCSAKISERRREELTTALRNWSEQETDETRRLLLVTFTLQHQLEDDLPTVFDALKRARRLLVSGRPAQNFNAKHGIIGLIRSLELTHGEHGWHPHLHVLMFFDREVAIGPFTEAIKRRWSECVKQTGRYASWRHGVDVRFSDRDIAAYVAKWGKEPKWTAAHELAKGVTKKARREGRTPLQLLDDYLNGDQRAGELWLQYAVVFKGERQIRWSDGLRARLGLVEEKTDEEIAVEQEEIAVILSSLSVGAWRVVIANDARGELLEIAATGDAGQVEAFLRKLGVGQTGR